MRTGNYILGVFLAMVIIGVWSARYVGSAIGSKETLPVLAKAPDFVLEDSAGTRFSSDALKGKSWIAHFFFSSCPHVCPRITGDIGRLYKKYQGRPGFEIVSITVDPNRDTTQVLADYAKRFNADTTRWHFLRGELEATKALIMKGFLLPSTDDPMAHTARVVLVDRAGGIRGYFDTVEERGIEKLDTAIDELTR